MALNKVEIEVTNAFRNNSRLKLDKHINEESMTKFFLFLMMQIGKKVRAERAKIVLKSNNFKKDGSPITELENQIELFIQKELNTSYPQIKFLGEELGGELPVRGFGIAVDPIDGTWSFLSQNNTVSTSLALFKDQEPFLGMILNHATAELGYCYKGQKSRIIQFDVFGEQDIAYYLPNNKMRDDIILINLHPHSKGFIEIQKLYKLWGQGRIKMVKSSGGSPAWAILEASIGHFIYINKWDTSPSKSYDLAASKLIIEGSGGTIVDRKFNSIPALGHQGIFFAGISKKNIEYLLNNFIVD